MRRPYEDEQALYEWAEPGMLHAGRQEAVSSRFWQGVAWASAAGAVVWFAGVRVARALLRLWLG